MKTQLSYFALGVLLLLGTGCEQQLNPMQVTQRFWQAVEAQDRGAVRLFVTRESVEAVRAADGILPLSTTGFGKTTIEGERAQVETTVALAGDKPVPVPLKTYLRQEDGRWKVEYQQTVGALSERGDLAAWLARLREFNQQFSRQVDRSIEDLQRALPEIEREFKQFEESVNEQIPALKEELEEFGRKLEEALKDLERPPPSQHPIAI